jgi:mannose-6-phosphate isomerase-like protein (cupin superfamily)
MVFSAEPLSRPRRTPSASFDGMLLDEITDLLIGHAAPSFRAVEDASAGSKLDEARITRETRRLPMGVAKTPSKSSFSRHSKERTITMKPGDGVAKVSLRSKFALIDEHWRPKVAASLNGQEVKLVKFCGTFPWHTHLNEDEMFLVWNGSMVIEFRDQSIELGPGELCVVPRGVEHRTRADTEAEVLVFEPAQTRNTGDIVDDRFTAPNGIRI